MSNLKTYFTDQTDMIQNEMVANIIGWVPLLVLCTLLQDLLQAALDCNETECGPRVSKCMLLKACNCSINRDSILHNNCSCCNECIQCLDKQYMQCCACVGMSSFLSFIK